MKESIHTHPAVFVPIHSSCKLALITISFFVLGTPRELVNSKRSGRLKVNIFSSIACRHKIHTYFCVFRLPQMPHCRFVLARNTTPQLCDKNTLRLIFTSKSTMLMPSAQKTGNLFLISCFGAPFYVAAVIQFSFDNNSINGKLLRYDGLFFLIKQWCQSSCVSILTKNVIYTCFSFSFIPYDCYVQSPGLTG